ncbi:MAG TPA: RNA methyltransferase substrate-binding domain-containing protein, partial [Gammaproteobacteria bacterium]|nr:RNA methyltransferase substrate-binding domain-containing protein [Gammaproteobacteria bacterium]
MANRRQHLYGLHAVRAVLERRPKTVLAAKVLRDASGKLAELERALTARGIALERVSRGDLDRLAEGGVHQGVVVEVAAAPEFSIGDFEALVVERGRALRLLVLDGVEDPRNLGACLRTADAAGVDAVVVPRDHSAKLTATA